MANQQYMKLWSIGGGKGGVGKSIVTMGLGISLARLGNRVILVDGDLGAANLHTMMGLRFPPLTLEDFLLKRLPRLEDVVVKTPIEGISLICGADDLLGAANPTYFQKIRVLRELEDLPADFVLLDLGAGTSFNILDFFNHSSGKIAVFTGISTSLQNVYGFIKCALFRKISREFAKDFEILTLLYEDEAAAEEINSMDDLVAQVRRLAPDKCFRLLKILRDFEVFLVTNMVKNEQDFRAAEIIQSVCADFLNIKPQILGHLLYDPLVDVAINQMVPSLLHQRDNKIIRGLEQIAKRMMRLARRPLPTLAPDNQKAAPAASLAFWKGALNPGS
ncbi:MAG: P-loop NTPase [Deltaproteobacteria bacterium]|nr:P-loop NTPase [Deltaproteobacteria bacterium]